MNKLNLDNLELLSFDNCTNAFPKHFHETYCISLIRGGTETISLADRIIYGQSGDVTITQPFEVHANPLATENLSLSFHTIYINSDLFDYCAGKKRGTYRIPRKVSSPHINQLFWAVNNICQKSDHYNKMSAVESILKQFIRALIYQRAEIVPISTISNRRWVEIDEYIQPKLKTRLTLDDLSSSFYINKFSFLRNFKSRTGMTPMQYVTMKKIFAAKSELMQGRSISDLTFEYQFTDLAHFSKSFKHFVGLTPRQYLQTIGLYHKNDRYKK